MSLLLTWVCCPQVLSSACLPSESASGISGTASQQAYIKPVTAGHLKASSCLCVHGLCFQMASVVLGVIAVTELTLLWSLQWVSVSSSTETQLSLFAVSDSLSICVAEMALDAPKLPTATSGSRTAVRSRACLRFPCSWATGLSPLAFPCFHFTMSVWGHVGRRPSCMC